MNERELKRLLGEVKSGKTSVANAAQRIAAPQNGGLDVAEVDHHRELRCGFPEVVLCQGKEPDDAARIAEELFARADRVLLTRARPDVFAAVRTRIPGAEWHDRAKAITCVRGRRARGDGFVLVVTAGTADIPVAEEARVTAELMGAYVETCFDVGVAGLHRILGRVARLREARVIVVAAGMEGALASVVGGLVARPVIAVPTSVGYGASFQGLAALLGMLNSCAPNVAVVNIDNGFGAGYLAALMNQPIRRS